MDKASESSEEVSSNSEHEICTKITYAQYANDETFTRKVIPDTVVEIEDKAFYECRKLTSIFLPDKLESIGRECFSECFSLEMINIPDSVRFIRSDAFSNCKNLRYVKLPKNLKSIPYGMFRNCTKLTSVEIPITVDNIQWGAFYRCESLAAISLPDGIRHIPTNCFYACKSLHNFTFAISEKDPYVTIGARALSNCINLVKVDLSCSSVYSIGEGCFAFCRSLESVVLSKKTGYIKHHAFYYCDSLLYIGYEHTSFHEFKGKRLFGIDVKYVTEIEDDAFSHCPKLEYFKLYEHQKLRRFVFDGTNLGYILLPGNMYLQKGDKIFEELKGVKEVMICAKIPDINYGVSYEVLWELVQNNRNLADQPCTIDNLYPLEVLIGVLGWGRHPYRRCQKKDDPLADEDCSEELELLTILFRLLTWNPNAFQYYLSRELYTDFNNVVTL